MGSIARIISTTIDNYIISVIEKRLGFKIESYHFSPSGDDSPPLPQDKVFTAKKDGTGKYVVLGNLMISQGAKAGEKILYARDSNGSIKSKLYFKGDGSFVFNDGSDNAVRYSKLEAAFNQLKSDFNSLVTKYNADMASILAVNTAAGSGTGFWPFNPSLAIGGGQPSTADITPSKIEEIKVS